MARVNAKNDIQRVAVASLSPAVPASSTAIHAERSPTLARVKQLRIVANPSLREEGDYVLDDQPGFLFRLVLKRHTTIFTQSMIGGLTPPQFSAMAKLLEVGPTSQNYLGRLIAFDQATIKGIVDRLKARGLVELCADPSDKRRRAVTLTSKGQKLAERATERAADITLKTVAPLSEPERRTLVRLLKKLT